MIKMNKAGNASYIVPTHAWGKQGRPGKDSFNFQDVLDPEYDPISGIYYVVGFWTRKNGQTVSYRWGPYASALEADLAFSLCVYESGVNFSPGKNFNRYVRPLLFDVRLEP
jgi:hypothetical protein